MNIYTRKYIYLHSSGLICQEHIPSSGVICQVHIPSSGLIFQEHMHSSVLICQEHIPSSVLICQEHIPSSGLICQVHIPSSGLVCTRKHIPSSGLICPKSANPFPLCTSRTPYLDNQMIVFSKDYNYVGALDKRTLRAPLKLVPVHCTPPLPTYLFSNKPLHCKQNRKKYSCHHVANQRIIKNIQS